MIGSRRTVTRTVFASPIFWLAFIAYVAGNLIGPIWVGVVAGGAIGALSGAIEHWYCAPRRTVTNVTVEQCAACRSVTGSARRGPITLDTPRPHL